MSVGERDRAGAAETPVLVRLRALSSSLTPAGRRLADVVLSAPREAADLTISELAVRADTSETSVLRFARVLGFGGYPGLRLALAEAGADQRSVVRLSGDLDADDSIDDIVAKVTQTEAAAVEETAYQLDRRELSRVAMLLAGAGCTQVFGVGASALVAQDLQQKLHRIGRRAHVTSDTHLALAGSSMLRAGDAAVAISHSGTTKEAVEVLRAARGAGARTVAITNHPHAPLARVADHVLTTAASETTLRSGATASRIAALFVVDCLFLATAQRDLGGAKEALVRTRRSVAGHHHPPG